MEKNVPVVESTDMELRNPDLLPPPPGAVNALVNGFNAVANHVGVILFPALLDLFLWLGPQLKADVMLAPVFELAQQLPASQQTQALTETMTEFVRGFNLFSTLRTFPLGIFSLMTVNLSLTSPLGARLQLDPGSIGLSLLMILALTLLGWIGAGLYYRAVAGVVNKEQAPGLIRPVLHSTLLSGLWMVSFAILYLPVVVFVLLLGMINETLRVLILILLSFPLSWVLIGVYYSSYGIFTGAQNAFQSTWNSFRMVRYSLPNIGWFSMLVIILSQGMDMLWRIPPAKSWMTLVGILGHAFISTSLLAASLIYYRELNAWIEVALKWFKTKNISSARA